MAQQRKTSGGGEVLLGRVLHQGDTLEAGTKVSEVDFSDEEKQRLERLNLIGSAQDLEEQQEPEPESQPESSGEE